MIDFKTHRSPHLIFQEIGHFSCKWSPDGFWGKRSELCLKATIPSIRDSLNNLKNSAVFKNFITAANSGKGEFYGVYWSDGDCYKFLESLSYFFASTGDKNLELELDEHISNIANAQEADGYINTQIQLLGEDRWNYRPYHEDYNLGHLFTSASVHHLITGKTNFLNIAIKAADCLIKRFRDDSKAAAIFGWNPSHLMGLIDLYRATENPAYLNMVAFFINVRGTEDVPPCRPEHSIDTNEQNQMGIPLKDENVAVGHAVTAAYLYCGGADLFSENGDKELFEALQKIWDNIATSKVYVTGAIGVHHSGTSTRGDKINRQSDDGDRVHEAFGMEYRLPNSTAYNETCANIGNAMFSYRMLMITGESKYADMMETVMYNSGLSGNSIDGERFCYTNPLEWRGQNHTMLSNDTHERWKTFTCFCCPPQVGRTIAKIHSWAYSLSNDGVVFNLYGSNVLKTALINGEEIEIRQSTNYPWEGEIIVNVDKAPKSEATLSFRIPTWANEAQVILNKEPVNEKIECGQFFHLKRSWQDNDEIKLIFTLKPRMIRSHPFVEETRNQVAIAYGPVIYCLESIDIPNNHPIENILIPKDFKPEASYQSDLLGGIVALEGKVFVQGQEAKNLYQDYNPNDRSSVSVKMIPYYAWNNRGEPSMSVWLPLA